MRHEQIAARLRLALEQEAARHELSADAWPQIERRLRRQPWRRAGIAAVCSALLAAAVTAAPYLWHAVSSPAPGHPHPAAQLVIAGRTRLSPGITKVVTGYGGVWVHGPGLIYRVDPATGKTVTTIPAGGTGVKLGDIAAGPAPSGSPARTPTPASTVLTRVATASRLSSASRWFPQGSRPPTARCG